MALSHHLAFFQHLTNLFDLTWVDQSQSLVWVFFLPQFFFFLFFSLLFYFFLFFLEEAK